MTFILDKLDRKIINALQNDFPVCDSPFARVASQINTTEQELMERVRNLLDTGVLTRFGPMFHAANIGGALSLCAMKVPEQRFSEVTEMVNQFPEVAHNYQRDHDMNMWFVLATETEQALAETISLIENETDLPVYNMPKQKEFFVGLKFTV